MAHRCLLFVVYEAPHIGLAMSLARYGREIGDYHTIIWSPFWLNETPSYQQRASQYGSIYVHEHNADGSLAGLHNVLSGWLSSAPARLRTTEPQDASQAGQSAVRRLSETIPALADAALRAADRLARRVVVGEDWLVRLGVDALVLPEDNVERDSSCWVESARRRGIPATVVTSGVVDAKGAEMIYKHSAAHAVPAGLYYLVRDLLPHWLREGRDYSITRLPLAEAIGYELAGLAPKRPWLLNTGTYPSLAIESSAMVHEYENNGYDRGKLFATGHPSLDTLSHARSERRSAREALASNYGYDQSKSLCLIAIPPNRHATRQAPEYPSYRDLIDGFVAPVSLRWPGTVIVSPHPAMTEEEQGWVTLAGGTLVRRPVAELLPLADLYICGVSSTIKWALACGVPVVCYEAYRYDADMTAFNYVELVPNNSAYGDTISRLSNTTALEGVTTRASANSAYWGQLDGLNLERVVSRCFGDAN